MNRERFEIVKHPTSGSWHVFRYSGTDFQRWAVVYSLRHAELFCEAVDRTLPYYVREEPGAYPETTG